MNRALVPLLLALPLGCRGTFDLDKYVADGESGTMTSATSLDDTATTDASETRGDDTTDTQTHTETGTDTNTETDTDTNTDTDTSTDTDAECMLGLIDVGGACIGLEQTLLVGGNAPTDIAIGDFSGDGWIDLLVPGAPVSYFAGAAPNGTFGDQTALVDASGPGLAVTDFDNDGYLDFMSIRETDFQIFLSSGDGSFVPSGMYMPGGYDAAFGDFDGNQEDDIILSGPVLVGYQRDNGSFMHNASLVYAAQGLVVANFDDDNDLDIAIAMTAMGQVGVILTDGAWGFANPIEIPLPFAADVAVASIDVLDGLELIAVGGQDAGQLLLLSVQGNLIQDLGTYTVGGSPRAVAVGDINGDQLTDVAVGNASTHDVSILLGEGGSLTNEFRLPADDSSDTPETIEVADLDNDGRAEIIVGMLGSNRVLVYGHMQ